MELSKYEIQILNDLDILSCEKGIHEVTDEDYSRFTQIYHGFVYEPILLEYIEKKLDNKGFLYLAENEWDLKYAGDRLTGKNPDVLNNNG